MLNETQIRSSLPHWLNTGSAASDVTIRQLTDEISFTLPSDYLDLLRLTDGGETFLGDDDSDDGSYLVLWPSSNVIAMNSEYQIFTDAPDYFGFGANGGCELFAFDKRRSDDAVFMLPAIGLSNDAGMLYCTSLAAMLNLLPTNAG